MDTETLEKIMNLAQRTDKLEFTLADLRDELKNLKSVDIKEWKAICETRSKDEQRKNNDWTKLVVAIVILLALTSGVLWYSITTRMAVVENLVVKESDVVKNFVTKDNIDKRIIEQLRVHEKDYHVLKNIK